MVVSLLSVSRHAEHGLLVLPQLWEALAKRLDRELDADASASSSSGDNGSDGDDSDSSSEDGQSDSGDGGGGKEAAPQKEPAASFQLFGCEPHAVAESSDGICTSTEGLQGYMNFLSRVP